MYMFFNFRRKNEKKNSHLLIFLYLFVKLMRCITFKHHTIFVFKPFETPQRKVEIKIKVDFYFTTTF